MTAREAVIQAHIELGKNPEEAKLKAEYADGCSPIAAILTQSTVRPGVEREFIDFLKQLFGAMDNSSEAWKAGLERELGGREKQN